MAVRQPLEEMTPRFELRCLACAAPFDGPAPWAGCPHCARQGRAVNLSVSLELPALAGRITRKSFRNGRPGLWRFAPLLPVDVRCAVSLGEGATPLLRLDRLGARLGLQHLFAKDEGRNPTWSYKDRLASLAISHAVQSGARIITVSSTGNHGAAVAAYAARAHLPCVIFTLASVPETMKTLMQAYGAAVVACRTPEHRWELMREGVERLGWYPASAFVNPPIGSNPYGVEGYKTLAYEIAEALEWRAPDIVVVPSGYSDGLFGIWKGMDEMRALKLIDRVPRMVAAEPFGPLANAIDKALEVPEPVLGDGSVAFSIAVRNGTYQGLKALRESSGFAERVTDKGVLEAQRWCARDEGLFVEPSSAAAVTAAMQLRKRGLLGPDDTVVVVLTSSGLKDPGASRTWLQEVPEAPENLDDTLRVLEESYGVDFAR